MRKNVLSTGKNVPRTYLFLDFPDIKTIFGQSIKLWFFFLKKTCYVKMGPKQNSDHFEHPWGHIFDGFSVHLWPHIGPRSSLLVAQTSQLGVKNAENGQKKMRKMRKKKMWKMRKKMWKMRKKNVENAQTCGKKCRAHFFRGPDVVANFSDKT